jgi:hypothetical protein
MYPSRVKSSNSTPIYPIRSFKTHCTAASNVTFKMIIGNAIKQKELNSAPYEQKEIIPYQMNFLSIMSGHLINSIGYGFEMLVLNLAKLLLKFMFIYNSFNSRIIVIIMDNHYLVLDKSVFIIFLLSYTRINTTSLRISSNKGHKIPH